MKQLLPQRAKITRFARFFAITTASIFGGFFAFCFGAIAIGAIAAKFGPAWALAGLLLTISFCAAVFAFFVYDRL